MKVFKPIKINYMYQQLISHMGVLLGAFLVLSLVFTHYVERLVYQNKVDELVSYGENILLDMSAREISVSDIMKQYSTVLNARSINFSFFDEKGKILHPSGKYVTDWKLVDDVMEKISKGETLVVKNRVKHSEQDVTLVALPYFVNNKVIGGIFLTAPISGTREMISQIHQYLLFTVFFALALSILPSWLLSRIHVNRIKRLQEATSMIAAGDYSVQLPPSDFDEIDELATDFNHMVKKLNTAAEEIESLDNRRRNFMSDVSHELRTPLTTISGVIEGLKNGMIAEEEKEKGIHLVSQETKRLIRLVNENLDYDKIRSNQINLMKEDIQLLEVFEIIQETLAIQANDKDNCIEIDVDDDVYVCADYDRLIQILINITKNSIQFTEGGRITLIGRQENNTTIIEIEDTGIGIDPSEVENIWHRFYKAEVSRTSNPFGEFGLGLSIVKQLVHLHNGNIEVVSKKNEGTRFIIGIPYIKIENKA